MTVESTETSHVIAPRASARACSAVTSFAHTPASCQDGARFGLTDAQWAVLEPLLPVGAGPGRPPVDPRRRWVDGVRRIEGDDPVDVPFGQMEADRAR
ncbi:transposase [Streptomyces sp. NPDC048483]|uniref:transposase n=1 Tax=Streptomyces sp. NPDC048483 TaxID=3154927 RepID=UPI003412BC15